ncbi:uncharacterized protein [Eurosta solidaginis]|uniref:uncharacterized protein n=1 Tax=Eurosta solidaginis TaxID=178769 RepID=UPI003530F709
MKPFARDINPEKGKYNKHISRGRIRIEIAFGILAAQWRIFQNPINLMPENAKKVVLATVVLHNFLRFHKVNTREQDPNPPSNLNSISREVLNTSNASTQQALQNTLCNYINEYR